MIKVSSLYITIAVISSALCVTYRGGIYVKPSIGACNAIQQLVVLHSVGCSSVAVRNHNVGKHNFIRAWSHSAFLHSEGIATSSSVKHRRQIVAVGYRQRKGSINWCLFLIMERADKSGKSRYISKERINQKSEGVLQRAGECH